MICNLTRRPPFANGECNGSNLVKITAVWQLWVASPSGVELSGRLNEMPCLNFFLAETRDEIAASVEVGKIFPLG